MKINRLLLVFLFLYISCSDDGGPAPIDLGPDFDISAGNDLTNVNDFSVRLNAKNLEDGEEGVWSIELGLIDDKVYIEDENDPKTIFHGLPGETYQLKWTVVFGARIKEDFVSISFAPLQTEILNVSEDFYSTKLRLEAVKYDYGEWTIDGPDYASISSQCNGGEPTDCPYFKIYGYANQTYTLTWTTWYGSSSASVSYQFNTGEYSQDEALEDLSLFYNTSSYEKNSNGDVIGIFMGGNGAAWRFRDIGLFPALTSLVHLETLVLYGDGFQVFPSVIGDYYHKLKYLDVSANAFSNIPSNIGNLVELETLIAYNNQMGRVVGPLPESFGQLTKLKELKMSSMGISSIPESFSNLTELVTLDLEGNIIEKLPDDFGNLTQLKTFRGPAINQNLPESFSNLSSLEFFFFSNFDNDPTLPQNFGNLTNLKTLWLFGSYNELPASFTQLSALEDLEISGGSQMTALPDDFGNLTGLTDLFLAGNITTLPDSFANLSNLRYLRIVADLQSLPENFGNLDNLEGLILNQMSITSLPDSFSDLASLKNFDLSQNGLTALPSNIGNLPAITEIEIRYNEISSFPSSIADLADTLTEIVILGNPLSAQEIENLQNMLPNTIIVQ